MQGEKGLHSEPLVRVAVSRQSSVSVSHATALSGWRGGGPLPQEPGSLKGQLRTSADPRSRRQQSWHLWKATGL